MTGAIFMNARVLCAVAICMVGVSTSMAQSADFQAVRWNGGELHSSLRSGVNASGAGLSRSTLGSLHAAYGPFDAASVFGNPAALAFVDIPQVAIDFRLPMANGTYGVGPASLLSASQIQRTTDGFLEDLSYASGNAPVYTRADRILAGQPRQLSSIAASYPFDEYAVVSVGFRQPVLMEAVLVARGNELLMQGVQDDGSSSTRIDLSAALNVDAGVDVSLREMAFGAGGLLDDYSFGSIWWGGSAYRTHASVGLSMHMLPQAAIAIGGANPFYFNNPDDPNLDRSAGETNDFFWNVNGAYAGAGWGFRGGLVYRPYSEAWGATVNLNLAPRLDMGDRGAYAEGFLPAFVDIRGAMNDPFQPELFNVEAVDLSRPNVTARTRDAMGSSMRIRLPSSLTLGLDRVLGRHRLAINATRYEGEFALSGQYGIRDGRLQPYVIGKRTTWGGTAALDLARPRSVLLAIPLRLITLDVDGVILELLPGTRFANPRYRFSGGFVSGPARTTGIDNSFADDLSSWIGGIVPTSLGVARTYTLFNTVHIGVNVYSVPDLLFRFTIAAGGHPF